MIEDIDGTESGSSGVKSKGRAQSGVQVGAVVDVGDSFIFVVRVMVVMVDDDWKLDVVADDSTVVVVQVVMVMVMLGG